MSTKRTKSAAHAKALKRCDVLEKRLKLLDGMIGNVLFNLRQGREPKVDEWTRCFERMAEVSSGKG